MKEYSDRLYNELKSIKSKTPILLVGGAVTLFKKMYKGNIYKITNADETRDFVANFYGLELDKPIVLEDISLLSYDTQFLLLKLVEEAKFPIVILTLQDKVSPIILSRIKTYIKFPLDLDIECKFMEMPDAQNELDNIMDEKKLTMDNTDKTEEFREKFYAESCPELLYLEHSMGFIKNKKSYIEIMRTRRKD